jgi:hypothetical protein
MVFYCQDTTTGQQQSLRTKDEGEARTLLSSKNEAFRQPILNVQIEVVPKSWTGRIVKSKPEIRSRKCPRNDVSITLNSKRKLL